MAVYEFDTDVMRDTSDYVNEKAESLEGNLNNCRKNVDINLSQWTGQASGVYKESNNLLCDSILNNVDILRAAAAYNNHVADVLDEAEDSLASMVI
jgi:uncharacterized protein YukE